MNRTGAEETAPYTLESVTQSVLVCVMDPVARSVCVVQKTHIGTKMDSANALGNGRDRTVQYGQVLVVTDA